MCCLQTKSVSALFRCNFQSASEFCCDRCSIMRTRSDAPQSSARFRVAMVTNHVARKTTQRRHFQKKNTAVQQFGLQSMTWTCQTSVVERGVKMLSPRQLLQQFDAVMLHSGPPRHSPVKKFQKQHAIRSNFLIGLHTHVP